ncbi:TPA: hypothetical protein HIF30_003744 [Escherichia coli]|nr:hypothetical protein [Escherichia coli]HAH9930691.1 hypothetical protein [Escherichia coli]
MGSSVVVDALKDLLPILSGVLGVLGVFNIFKSSTNKLTVWGWVAIMVITISAIVGFYLSRVDRYNADKEKDAAQIKINSILIELERAKHPINEVEMTVWSILPDSNREVLDYKNFIKGKVNNWKEKPFFPIRKDKSNDLQATTYGLNNKPINFDIDKKSKFWPKKNFPLLSSMAEFYSVNLCVNMKRINPEDFLPVMGSRPSIDWCTNEFFTTDNTLSYDVEKDEISLITHIKYSNDLINSNGRLTSINDLYGSRIFFRLPFSANALLDGYLKGKGFTDEMLEIGKNKNTLMAQMKLSSVILSFGKGQKIDISGNHMSRYTKADGSTFFFVDIPNKEEDLYKIGLSD